MTQIVISIGVAAVVSFAIYLGREKAGPWGVALALLRTVALAGLILLFLNPRYASRVEGGPPTILLDASLSMGESSFEWSVVLDTVRSLAGEDGTILRFGSDVDLFQPGIPDQGASLLREALLVGIAGGGPTVVVTDGEVGDVSSISPALIERARVVQIPREIVQDRALLDVSVPRFIGSADSVRVNLTVGTFGGLDASTARVEIVAGGSHIAAVPIQLTGQDGVVRREFVIPADLLGAGQNVVEFDLSSEGDMHPENDARVRLITVTAQPAIVVLVDPADWEGRFLFREVGRVAQMPVKGYARIQDDVWVDMTSSARVGQAMVDVAVRGASVVISRGPLRDIAGKPVWRWPAGSDGELELFAGDWYASSSNIPSPLAGSLVGIAWDSLPPLTGIIPLVPPDDEWTALSSREVRRGAERPVLLGKQTNGTRQLTTVASGMWRWAFRGGASLEAYRAIVSAGIDWLLGAEVLRRRAPLEASGVVKRGEAVLFHWRPDSEPAHVNVTISTADTTWTQQLSFGSDGFSAVRAEPGVYSWSSDVSRDSRGTFVVESYSDEFVPVPVTLESTPEVGGETLLESNLRDIWWIYLIVVAALAGEWGLRQRRGLP